MYSANLIKVVHLRIPVPDASLGNSVGGRGVAGSITVRREVCGLETVTCNCGGVEVNDISKFYCFCLESRRGAC